MKRDEFLIQQYQKMIDIGLHYDQKLWLIPGVAYTISGVFYNVIMSIQIEPSSAGALALLNAIIFFSFLLQFVKDRAFQLGNQYAIDEIKKELGMVTTSEFSGIQPTHPKDRWFIRYTRTWPAISTVVYVMLITLLFHLSVSVYFFFFKH